MEKKAFIIYYRNNFVKEKNLANYCLTNNQFWPKSFAGTNKQRKQAYTTTFVYIYERHVEMHNPTTEPQTQLVLSLSTSIIKLATSLKDNIITL